MGEFYISLPQARVAIDATVADLMRKYPGMGRNAAVDTMKAIVEASRYGAIDDPEFEALFSDLVRVGVGRREAWAVLIDKLTGEGEVRG